MNLNIFHGNINGLGSKIDNLHEFLFGTSTKIDISAITETSEKEYSGNQLKVELLFMCLRILTKLKGMISI